MVLFPSKHFTFLKDFKFTYDDIHKKYVKEGALGAEVSLPQELCKICPFWGF